MAYRLWANCEFASANDWLAQEPKNELESAGWPAGGGLPAGRRRVGRPAGLSAGRSAGRPACLLASRQAGLGDWKRQSGSGGRNRIRRNIMEVCWGEIRSFMEHIFLRQGTKSMKKMVENQTAQPTKSISLLVAEGRPFGIALPLAMFGIGTVQRYWCLGIAWQRARFH